MATLTNNGICRCCASEGTFKDVRSVYVWMGEEEIYADMLKECFDITLSAQEGLSGVCEVCVTQLRNARNFKRQVLDIEDRFRRHLFDDLLNRECTPAPHSLLVKMEVQAEGHSESEPDDVDDEDYTPEFKEVPVIKREASEEPKAKRRAKTTAKKKEDRRKSTASRKKIVLKKNLNFSTFINIIPNDAPQPRVVDYNPQKTGPRRATELEFQYDNLRTILRCTNATPIKGYSNGKYLCGYCPKKFRDPKELKTHSLNTHGHSKPYCLDIRSLTRYLVLLEISDLLCKFCQTSFVKLEEVMEHLKREHSELIHMDIKNYMIPFKLVRADEFPCAICRNYFQSFDELERHMAVHYANFICECCDNHYLNRMRMLDHMKQVHDVN